MILDWNAYKKLSGNLQMQSNPYQNLNDTPKFNMQCQRTPDIPNNLKRKCEVRAIMPPDCKTHSKATIIKKV